MVNYRKLKLGDLDLIYKDLELRPLITSSRDSKFAVVMEHEDNIIGGAAGYVIENAAFMQNAIVKEKEQYAVYMDGLLRSLIHFLELDGVELLFVEGEDILYSSIGFHKLLGTEDFMELHKLPLKEAFDIEQTYWINLREFFKHGNI